MGSTHQRRRALARANHVRSARAGVKRGIACGDLTAAEVILAHRWEIATMPIADVLVSQRRWGGRRSRDFLVGLTMHDNKTIGSMTERQRIAMAALLTAAPLTARA